MPEVAFHTGIDEPYGYACRLLRKAYRQGTQVMVTASMPAILDTLDKALWTFEPQEFVPHVRVLASTTEAVLRLTPIWLLSAPVATQYSPAVLVNMGSDLAHEWPSVQRIVEIVADRADDLKAARLRWRAYEASGAAVTHHARAAT